MSELTYIVCRYCEDELPLTEEDRLASPYLADMTVRLHLDSYCEWVDTAVRVLMVETVAHLRKRAEEFCPERRVLDGHLHGCNNPVGHVGGHYMRRL